MGKWGWDLSKKYRRGRRKEKKGGGLLSTLILIVAIAIFLFAGFQLFTILKGYFDGKKEYDDVRDLVIKKSDKVEKDEEIESDKFVVDFDELSKMNPDTIGWIRFHPEPANISYPIVQTDNNDTYLHKTFSASDNSVGAIFLNAYNNSNLEDHNSIIYGHYMNDKSMFHNLWEYESEDFWKANPNFYIYTPDGRVHTYAIFSVAKVKDMDDLYNVVFNNDDEVMAQIEHVKGVSLYDTKVEVGTDQPMITLSTCTSVSDSEERFVVVGVRKEVDFVNNK
ncbi:SrtB family sortase [Aequitasia blattaphilus]|uniref:Class B sortase n=1 Tax=Aequitasia blattaphilus TaxID=2949332 RepID=A0ABT1ECL0_9FIRM|nr:class B sortase [Aequitasia blattaphilus]MCP1103533.1 class B sortase [Aequitasia blattaphilus]MCR8616173.1 class B sortase [Aequitasia blattaphilus]